MKKLSAFLLALVLVAATAITAFAAGINANEKSVLDTLKKPINMNGNAMYIPADFVNQAENYFNTIEMTEQESKDINAKLLEMGKFLEGTGANNIADMQYGEKQQLLNYGKEVVGVIGMTMEYDKATKNLIIYAPDGSIAFKAVPTLVPNSDGKTEIVDGDAIKTTGANVDFKAIIAISAAAVLLIAGGAVYLVKSKKEA